MEARSGQAQCHIAADHPAFAGHFPGRAIVPGVILIDEAVHAIAAAIGHRGGWQLGAVKFIRPLGPGASVDIHWQASTSGKGLTFSVRCDDEAVASGSLTPLAGS